MKTFYIGLRTIYVYKRAKSAILLFILYRRQTYFLCLGEKEGWECGSTESKTTVRVKSPLRLRSVKQRDRWTTGLVYKWWPTERSAFLPGIKLRFFRLQLAILYNYLFILKILGQFLVLGRWIFQPKGDSKLEDETRQAVYYNVTLRRVIVTIVAVEKQ